MNWIYKKPFLIVSLFVIFSCSNNENRNTDTSLIQEENSATNNNDDNNKKPGFTIDTITTGLSSPWAMVFLPDGRMLITEKDGNIRIVQNNKLLKESIKGLPEIYVAGQGGLLDIKLHPGYKNNGWIYFTYAKPGQGGGGTTLSRAKLNGNTLTNLQQLFTTNLYDNSGIHFGSRIAFDGKGHVFVSTGERGSKSNAQKLSNHNGKVIRLNDDGSVPGDNPFVNTPGAMKEIWSYGHRNVQGLIYDEANDILWAHEHGPRGGDELGIIEPGKNYGWPVATYGIDYDGSTISNVKEKEGIQSPVHQWTPSIAPCGMTIVTTDKYQGWKGNLLIGALSYQYLSRVVVKNRNFVSEEKLLNKVARIRSVSESPDGFIFVLTESPGMLLKLIPESK